jgi:predicted neuraminidase
MSTSNDNGASWSAAIKTDIPNTASVEVCVLIDGRWIFIGNDIEGGRYRLSLYLSNDEGKTWIKKYTLENEEKGAGSFSYPSVIQSSDGLVHITYSYHKEHAGKSIKYVCIDVKSL